MDTSSTLGFPVYKGVRCPSSLRSPGTPVLAHERWAVAAQQEPTALVQSQSTSF